MYHCVPRIISGLSHRSGLSFQVTMPNTASGNSRLAGNAARNCAIGCTICVARGRSPTQMPIGTQNRLARVIRMSTRAIVISARPATCSASCAVVSPMSMWAMRQMARPTSSTSAVNDSSPERRLMPTSAKAVSACGGRGVRRLLQRTTLMNSACSALSSRERCSMVSAQECAARPPCS